MDSPWNDATSTRPTNRELTLFHALYVLGAVTLTALFTTAAISRSIHRNLAWYSFIASWIIGSISFSFLFLSGQWDVLNPNHSICIVSAALVYSAPPLNACTSALLIFPLWYGLRISMYTGKPASFLLNFLVALVPFLIWIIFLVSILVFNIHHPSLVTPNENFTYCVVSQLTIHRLPSIFVAVVAVLAIGFEIDLIFLVYKSYRSNLKDKVPFNSFIRIIIFSVFALVALGSGIWSAFTPYHSITKDIAVASLPVVTFLVFGTQRDILNAWVCGSSRVPLPSYTKVSNEK
ncbi:hypothetical protein DL96DRAFT_1705628 [Flagelloscypha sp. PMI_526]|nr:hypothetical protein DL96DRAFT_1705628 [Flagelloscypha sp. PMI_526]